ncbi:YciI family protein [Crossiella sp. CA-258035]|uniref:YciI family protein n=1 Tax=Crossiella sp. CA-258035 TaxID=2981138 RepID=UPI0024BD49CD|nr:YciI family protein [Crossiella sp. CA-258035]WHT17431.1 YciI family protein [Crossiella sp. CA-258035]
MKFLLIMQVNPAILDALTEEERAAIGEGHGEFIRTIQASGELILTQALADPAASAVVRGAEGQPVVTDGPFLEAKEFMGGFYLVECESKERALELAKLIPDTKVPGLAIEVRPVMFSGGMELEM